MKTPRRKLDKLSGESMSADFISGIEYLADSLIEAAGCFVACKAAIRGGDFHGAKKLLKNGFAECAVNSQGSDGIFARLAELQRLAKSQQKKSAVEA
jgi:hypothetical protein